MPKKSHPESLVFHFSIIDDPRLDRTKDHALIDILLIALCAMPLDRLGASQRLSLPNVLSLPKRLCGAEGFVDFEELGHAREEFLRSFLALPNGIPSHDPFRRVFALLDPGQFAQCFRNWTESLRRTISSEILPEWLRAKAARFRPSARSVVLPRRNVKARARPA